MRTGLSIYLKVFSFLALGLLLALGVHLALFVMRAPSGVKEIREVLVPEGASFRSVAAGLEKAGVVSDKETFVVLARLMDVHRKIRAGFYSFHTAMKPFEVLDMLREGRIVEYQVVLPEGYDLDKTGQAVEDAGLATKAEFLARALDPGYVRALGLGAETLEGYLFPATYFFPKGMVLDGVIKQMVMKFHEVFNDDLRARAAELGMSEHQAVTLASLIERESSVDTERLLISAVFHNRLRLGIPLQCDPCVIYALQRRGRWYGDLNRQNLRFKDPYNTYVYRGLPPGPIANPGKPSIIAALYPADVDYIYFVSKNDGTHFFSSSLKEHNRAVREFQVLAKLQNTTSVRPGSAAEKAAALKATAAKPAG